jgi:hypothetical protein
MFRNARLGKSHTRTARRTFHFENLERREVLSGSPTVVAVEIGSTAWSSAFVDYLKLNELGNDGYAIPLGSAAQSASRTWLNTDQIMIAFSEDVLIDAADLSLSGVNVTTYQYSDFHYDPQTYVATWTFPTLLGRDRLRLDLDADGIDPVCDLEGNTLDGEWINNVSTISGDGNAGGDFHFNFNLLPTDVNNTGSVTSYDYVYIRQLDGKSTNDVGYNPIRDIDGSGLIDSVDWQAALDRMTQTLPSGTPAGSNNDAPSTAGFDLVQIAEPEIDVAISLWDRFDDAESGNSGLTYSIQENSNPTLFDSLDIDTSTGQLIIRTADGSAGSGGSGSAGLSGRSTITIAGTDPGGLSVSTTITVDVNYENQPPLITNLFFASVGGGTWIIEGDVSDPDDDVSNFIVEFTGVFVMRSAVDENGHFEFAVILDEDDWGWEYAVTYDPHDAESNLPFGEIFYT